MMVRASLGSHWCSVPPFRCRPEVDKGFAITKVITPVEQKVKGQWSRGDVVRVTITFRGSQDQGWVVVDDPDPLRRHHPRWRAQERFPAGAIDQ